MGGVVGFAGGEGEELRFGDALDDSEVLGGRRGGVGSVIGDGDLLTGGEGAVVVTGCAGESEGGEGGDGESGVVRARLDEGRGKGVDLLEVQRCSVGAGDGIASIVSLSDEVALVLTLYDQDTSGRFDRRVGKVLRCPQVCRNTYAFEHASSGQERRHISHAAEVVSASGNSVLAKSRGQKLDVRSFIPTDAVDLVSNRSVVASLFEVGAGELGQRLVVEVGFKVLESESVLEDLSVVEASVGAGTSTASTASTSGASARRLSSRSGAGNGATSSSS